MNLESKQHAHHERDYGTHVREVQQGGVEIWTVIVVVAAFIAILAFAFWLLS